MENVTLGGMGSPWGGKWTWGTLLWAPSWAEMKDRDGFSSHSLAERFFSSSSQPSPEISLPGQAWRMSGFPCSSSRVAAPVHRTRGCFPKFLSTETKLLAAVSTAGIQLLPNQNSASPEGAASFEIILKQKIYGFNVLLPHSDLVRRHSCYTTERAQGFARSSPPVI